MIEIRKNAKYAIACPTSVGIRISPVNRMSVHDSNLFYMHATSAETNVLNVSSSLGLSCLAMTRFVAESPVALFIKKQLRARNISCIAREVPQGGPWGYRHQFNIADAGFGPRAARVWNDRAGEVGRSISPDDFDIPKLFGEEGIGILHITGLMAAMSEETASCCIELARAARTYGTLVSFDLNYRASFWKGREERLRTVFSEIASLADILLGNEEDFQFCLGVAGPEVGGTDLCNKIERFRKMLLVVREAYPNARVFATTLREVISANENMWGAVTLFEDEWVTEQPRRIEIMDRIGGGDGFAGGLLYSICQGFTAEKSLQFAWACGALAAASINDYAEPADEKQVWDIYNGNARVQR